MSDWENLPAHVLDQEIQNGARFIVYDYCISLVFISFQRSSEPVMVRANEDPILAGWKYTLLSLVMGWWGIPFGPIFTGMSLWTNLRGGRDITGEVLYHMGYR